MYIIQREHMSEIPYTPFYDKIDKYFGKFQEIGVPEKVDTKWLNSLGYKSGNDSYIIHVLKFIGFIDDSGNPKQLWRDFKDTQKSRAVLAQAIRTGYSELFKTYKEAHKGDYDTLYAFFSSKTGKAKATVNYMVKTFMNMCQLADFEAPTITPTPPISPVPPAPTPVPSPVPVVQLPLIREGGVVINVNIQLELPITQDAEVYDKIFQSLKKHLITPNSKTG